MVSLKGKRLNTCVLDRHRGPLVLNADADANSSLKAFVLILFLKVDESATKKGNE
jgi:hypothetical protein